MKSQYIMEKGCLVVYVPRELDHHQANRIRTETDLLIDTYHVRHLVFDFTETEFMDSSGIGLLMGRYRALGMRKDCIQAVGVNGHIGHLLRLSGLHRYIVIQKAGEGEVYLQMRCYLFLKVIRLMKGLQELRQHLFARS